MRSLKLLRKKFPTIGIAAVAPAPERFDAKCTLGISKNPPTHDYIGIEQINQASALPCVVPVLPASGICNPYCGRIFVAIDNTFQHWGYVGRSFVWLLSVFRQTALARCSLIFNTFNKIGFAVSAQISEAGISPYHFKQRYRKRLKQSDGTASRLLSISHRLQIQPVDLGRPART